MSLEFKLQFYYNLYKDFPVENRERFRKVFKARHGDFKLLEELILMIERYQVKKYGTTFYSSFSFMPSKKGRKK